jgi:hypothetical protein
MRESVQKFHDPRQCERCDSESKHLIKYMSPDNVTQYICWACVEREEKSSFEFSPTWKRQRRAHAELGVI